MGIQGLIPFLEKASRRINVSQFSGCSVAVDAYCWLHKGAFACAEKLARGDKCNAYVFYCMKLVNMLLSHNIKPILVFDGRHLPAKADTEKKRRQSREENRKRAAELLRVGRSDEARSYLRRCIDVTHDMALCLIRECRQINVDCIVAPYEADAQLAYLNQKGIAQAVITEDSDLVLFGCTQIIFKMDVMGNGLLVERERLYLAMGVRVENFSFDKFRYMCILSGCDYLPSLPGIGLGKALKFISRTSDPNIHNALTRIPSYLNMHNLKVTQEYRDGFIRADAAFRCQLVYDPLSRSMMPLTKDDESEEIGSYVGEELPSETAYQLALGNLDPFTLQKVDDFDPDTTVKQHTKTKAWLQSPGAHHPSIWSKGYTTHLQSQQGSPSLKGKRKQQIAFVDIKLFRAKTQNSTGKEQLEESDNSTLNLASLYKPSEDGFPYKKICLEGERSTVPLTEMSPVKEVHETVCTSPVFVRKSSCNPFLKKQANQSKGEMCCNSPNVKIDRELAEPKFSALSKFNSIHSTGKGEIIRSRYFADAGTVAPRENSVSSEEMLSSADIHSGTLKDVLNIIDKTDVFSKEDCHVHHKRIDSSDHKNVVSQIQEENSPKRLPSSNHRKLINSKSEESTCKPLASPKDSCEVETSSFASTFSWNQLHDTFSFGGMESRRLSNTASTKKTYKNPCNKERIAEKNQEKERELLCGSLSHTVSNVPVQNHHNSHNYNMTSRMLVSDNVIKYPSEESDVDDPEGMECSNLPEKSVDKLPTVADYVCTTLQNDPVKRLEKGSNSCRRPGLGKKALILSQKSKHCNSQQSLLSMFGFQKKVSISSIEKL